MKSKSLLLFGAALCSLFTPVDPALAQGTAFSYNGRLTDGGAPATGSYDLSFSLYAVELNGIPVAGPLTNSATAVSNGLFTVTLDFGAGVFTGADRFLEIAARTNGAVAFTTLEPRQKITPAPYAIFSANAGIAATATGFSGAIADSQLSGNIARLNSNLTFTGAVTLNNAGNQFGGTFTGNGTGVTNVNLSLNSGGAISLSGNFVLASSPPVGTSPIKVTAADVNGDGKMDLITANNIANPVYRLSVLTNDGSGGFVTASSPTVGAGPFSVAAADVNGDGKVDLISANFFGGTLTVLTNNGSGGFVTASSPTVGAGPFSVTAADVNGDGKVDLISANSSDNTLSVLTNNGSGGFAFASLVAVGDGPESVTAADVNGDGKMDLISANLFAATLSVLTNNGSGGFVTASTPGVGSNPREVTTADVNGDGKVDLISANGGNSTLSVLTNSGSGGFVLAGSPGVGLAPFSVTAADVNGDGKADLISANVNVDTLSVLINNGNGGFILAASLTVGDRPRSVIAADVNGDGKVDLISANETDNTLSVLVNCSKFQGCFAGNGSALTNLNAANVTGTLGPAQIPNLDASKIASGTLSDARLSAALLSNTFWRLSGNAGTTASNHFLGTTDNQPLEIRVNGSRVMRFEDNGDSSSDSDAVPDGAPNVIGGSPANIVGAGVVGATIAGGGATNYRRTDILGFYTVHSNQIRADFGTISGGANNLIEAGAALSTVGGGGLNFIQASAGNATIGGGLLNTVHTNASFATIGGGLFNTAQGIGAVIGGGGFDGMLFSFGNSTRGNASVIAGGTGNAIGNISSHTAIGGGKNNSIAENSPHSTIGGGENNTIADNSSHSTIGGGENNTIVDNSTAATIPGGREARAANFGQLAYASGAFAAVGDAQTSMHVLRGTTSNANQTEIFLNGISRRMIVPTNTTWAFDILIVARTSSSLSGAYHIRGVIENNAGLTTLDGTQIKDILNEDVGAWDVSVEADNTADALVIKVTGSATPVRWVASVRTVEVSFP